MRRGAALVALVLAGALPAGAAAHPLGNFTTNHYLRVEPSGDRLYALYVLDLAEIPTFQARAERSSLGDEAYARSLVGRIAAGISLRVDRRRRALRPLEHALTFRAGVGGLRTTRLEVVYDAGALRGEGPVAIEVANRTMQDRTGWRELVVRGGGGARVAQASVPARGVSDELRAYPEDRLASPPDVREARATVLPGERPGVAPALSGSAEAARAPSPEGGFAGLVAQRDRSAVVLLGMLGAALFWGAAHALGPGHGKAIVAAYLVGTRGRPRDAVLLGLIVTVTHTIGVFALGIVTLALSAFLVPEQLYPWLNLASALLVLGVGLTVLRLRVLDRAGRAHPHRHEEAAEEGDEHGHEHAHAQHHRHGHAHAHVPATGSGLRGLLAVGVSGGLLPCPTALVVLLAAVSLHRVALGLLLIVAFSVGLAAVVTCVGLVAISARRTVGRRGLESRAFRALPAASALLIVVLGVAMTARALPSLT